MTDIETRTKDLPMLRLSLLTTAVLLSATSLFAQEESPGSHFIANWDLDGDGAVTLAEATTKRGDVFTAFDADEDGRLADEEYAMFDEARANDQAQMREAMQANGGKGQGKGQGQGQSQGHGMGPGMNEEGGMMRAFNDTDADGFVSRDEFIGHTADWIAQMDRNGDGTVTAADFGNP